MRMLVAVLLLSAGAVSGQSQFSNDFRRDWQTSKDFTLAVADAMPQEKYGFKVSPAEMSFAGLMVHIATSQAFRFAQIAGKPVPFEMSPTIPKDSAKQFITDLIRQSFDFCITQIDSLPAEKLAALYKVDWYERPEVNGRELALGMLVHTAHHRAQAEVYLRANGIQPPVYRF